MNNVTHFEFGQYKYACHRGGKVEITNTVTGHTRTCRIQNVELSVQKKMEEELSARGK